MSSKSLLIFAALIYAKHNLASELCRSDNGYMTILNRTKIISNLIKGHGNNTILVDLDSEFDFTCHNNKLGKSAQILFGSEDSSNRLKNNSSVSRVLKNSSLTKNFVGTNSDPISINCEGVCQIEFIVLFNARSFCEDNSTDWDSKLDKIEEGISELFGTRSEVFDPRIGSFMTPMGPVIKTYKVIEPPNLICDTSETLFGLSPCFEELNSKEPPIEVIIEIEVQDFEKIYIKEQYWPPKINTTVTEINTLGDNSSVPTWVIIICIALSLAVIAIFYSTFQNLRFKAPGLEPSTRTPRINLK